MKIESFVPPVILDQSGGAVDWVLKSMGRLVERSVRRPLKVDRELYRRQLDFYIDQGYVDDPGSFFSMPPSPPPYEVRSEKAFLSGTESVITYSSTYPMRNPLLTNLLDEKWMAVNRQGYLFHWSHNTPGTPTVVCLHGFTLGRPREAQRMFRMEKLFGMGIDVALFITPFHWRRAPNKRLSGLHYLIPENAAATCENFGQTMHDLYSCLLMLKDRGAGRLGLVGASLGGYHAALFASLSDLAEFATLVVPGVDFLDYLEDHNFALEPPLEAHLIDKIRNVWRIHSPFSHRLRIPKERALIIAARGDGFCPFKHVQRLADHWGGPQHHYLTGGHWLFFDRRSRGAAWYRFLNKVGFVNSSAGA